MPAPWQGAGRAAELHHHRPSSIRAELHDQILRLVLPRAASFFLTAAAYLHIRVPWPFADPPERRFWSILGYYSRARINEYSRLVHPSILYC
ncbi:hypothetical protein C8F04DRAFT_1271506 [Mycena alexandri]|uniref:Uncharacterized protein n=1 Tax=Mycena alexandri TaxID=1745969 RepID=A0AAD6S8U2_9AGAR|nr:hypothetical protein C8F04DRAFT_1271506 [Mycena alexandri]